MVLVKSHKVGSSDFNSFYTPFSFVCEIANALKKPVEPVYKARCYPQDNTRVGVGVLLLTLGICKSDQN